MMELSLIIIKYASNYLHIGSLLLFLVELMLLNSLLNSSRLM